MGFDWGLLLTELLKVIITVVLGFALKLGSDAVNAYIKEKRASQSGKEFDTAVGIIRQLVLAAEQSGLIGAIANIGEEKKHWVIGMAEAELARRGINVDLDVLDALIEAQVKEAIKDVELFAPPAEG